MDQKKKKKWLKFRHRVVRTLAAPVVHLLCILRYGIRIEPFREQGNRPYLVLLNHQTAFDQFFVGLSFKGPVYYVASEDLFSKGWVSALIRYLVAPIPIKKQTTDINAVMNCIRVAREGGTIAMAPEGNRTYSGRTEYMNPAVAGLAKKMKLPIALYRIEGGYGIHPRWSDDVRRGKMRSYVSRVIEPEEYAAMSNEELLAEIEQGLFADEGCADAPFLSKRRAEYLERAMYVCPFCGLSEFESHGNVIACKKCGRKVEYGTHKTLTGVGFDFPFSFVTEWYDYQTKFVAALELSEYQAAPAYCDTAAMSEIIVYHNRNLLRKEASLRLYGDRIVVDGGRENQMILPFSEISAAAVLGRNKLNIYHEKNLYQFKGGPRFNALKYVNFYFRYKNVAKGQPDSLFLGL